MAGSTEVTIGIGLEKKSYWSMAAKGCDACRCTPALLFCRTHSAFLCSPCDSRLHPLISSSCHGRVWICDVCEQAPAAFTCKADAVTLCITCDADIHSANPLARRHDRVPVLPFFNSPTINTIHNSAADNLLLKTSDDGEEEEEEAEMKAMEMKVVGEKRFGSSVDREYCASMDNARCYQTDSVVPVQDRVMSFHHHHMPPALFVAPAASFDVDFCRSNPSYSFTPSLSHSVSSSEVGVVPDGNATVEIPNSYAFGVGVPVAAIGTVVPVTPAAVIGKEREARVMRYRERKKNRKFEKTIRYASRKAYAETRPRIKGRFAKRTEFDSDGDVGVDSIYTSSADAVSALLVDTGYGVVPSF